MLSAPRLLLAVLALTSLPSLNAQVPTCGQQYLRKEWRTLDDGMKERYINAVLQLQQSADGGPSKFDTYAAMHYSLDPQIHGNTAMFLPWHRYFLYKFEQDLRVIDPELFLPYWNWQFDSQSPELAPIWGTDNKSFGQNGDPANEFCVTSGPFANFQPTTPEQLPNGFTKRCLRRAWRGGETIEALPSVETVNLMISSSSTFEEFTMQAEGPAHAPTHVNIGGDMSEMYSPNDPVFWLHHCNVDKLWWNWQGLGDGQNLQAFGGTFLSGDPALGPQRPRVQATTDASLPGFEQDGVTVGNMFSTQTWCYSYQDMDTGTAQLPQLPPANFPGAPPVPEVPLPPPGWQDTPDWDQQQQQQAQPQGGDDQGQEGGDGGQGAQGGQDAWGGGGGGWGRLYRRMLNLLPLQLTVQLPKGAPQPPPKAAVVPPPKAGPPQPPKGAPQPPHAVPPPKAGPPQTPPAVPQPPKGAPQPPKGAPQPPKAAPKPVAAPPTKPPVINKNIVVKPATANSTTVDPRDRKNLLALRVVREIPSKWIKMNRLDKKKLRTAEDKYKKQVRDLNKVEGYVSPCALYNRPDTLVKIANKYKGKQEFTAVVKGKVYEIKPPKAQDPKQVSANALATLKVACGAGAHIQKPVAELAPKLLKLCGKPAFKKTSVGNPFRCRHTWGNGYGRHDF